MLLSPSLPRMLLASPSLWLNSDDKPSVCPCSAVSWQNLYVSSTAAKPDETRGRPLFKSGSARLTTNHPLPPPTTKIFLWLTDWLTEGPLLRRDNTITWKWIRLLRARVANENTNKTAGKGEELNLKMYFQFSNFSLWIIPFNWTVFSAHWLLL